MEAPSNVPELRWYGCLHSGKQIKRELTQPALQQRSQQTPPPTDWAQSFLQLAYACRSMTKEDTLKWLWLGL